MLERILEPEVMDTTEDAVEYDSMDHAEPNQSFVERLVELGAHGRVLDIGTGPGHIPIVLCDAIPSVHVTGIDLADEMLAIAERHRAASLHAERIVYRKADAKGLDFPEASFDTVYSNTILHHIPEPVAFLAEARRVLKPGGVLLIRDLFRPESKARLEELVSLYARDATPYQRELFAASLHAALTPDELRSVADQAGLGDAEIRVDTDRHVSLQIGR